MIFFAKKIQIDRGDHRHFCNDDIITDSWRELGSDINFDFEAEKARDRSPHALAIVGPENVLDEGGLLVVGLVCQELPKRLRRVELAHRLHDTHHVHLGEKQINTSSLILRDKNSTKFFSGTADPDLHRTH